MSIIQPYTCLRHVMENEHTECLLTDFSKVKLLRYSNLHAPNTYSVVQVSVTGVSKGQSFHEKH